MFALHIQSEGHSLRQRFHVENFQYEFSRLKNDLKKKCRYESVHPSNLNVGETTPTGTKGTDDSLALGEKFSWPDTVVEW